MSMNMPPCPDCGATTEREPSGRLMCVVCNWQQPDLPERNKGGRPTIYSEELADEICRRIASGKTLTSICEADDMPGYRTVQTWLRDDDKQGFRQNYGRARDEQTDAWADEIVDLTMRTERADVQLAALQASTKQWVMARRSPRKWSERKMNEHTGADGGPIKTEQVPPMSSELQNKLDEHKAGLAKGTDDTSKESEAK